jgi:hypothetical protein
MQSREGGHIINVASVVGRALDPEISSQSDQERVADHSGGAVSGTKELLRHQIAGVLGILHVWFCRVGSRFRAGSVPWTHCEDTSEVQ